MTRSSCPTRSSGVMAFNSARTCGGGVGVWARAPTTGPSRDASSVNRVSPRRRRLKSMSAPKPDKRLFPGPQIGHRKAGYIPSLAFSPRTRTANCASSVKTPSTPHLNRRRRSASSFTVHTWMRLFKRCAKYTCCWVAFLRLGCSASYFPKAKPKERGHNPRMPLNASRPVGTSGR
ncbi:MAG: hypothetical protein MZV64_17795 [Ignavibacteriales bacterium]|nr:hypothetical protein [Ignavibacteriales bacterium]